MSDRIVKDFAQPVYNCTFAFATGAEDHSSCTITVKDQIGNTIGEVQPLLVWMSSVASGEGLATTGPVSLAALTDGGTYLQELTSKKCAIVLTNSSGQFILDIEDDTTMTEYVCASPLAGKSGFINVSRVMSADDFGV